MQSINPATGNIIRTYAEHSDAELRARVAAAHNAFESWRRAPFERRAALLRSLAGLLGSREAVLARLITDEMGKPIAQSRAELQKCALTCTHYAEHAAAYLADEPVRLDGAKAYVHYEPLGVVLAIMPWNFPFWQALRAAIPALMAGNAMVLKHASNVSGCALAIEELLIEAGAPKGLFATLLCSSKRIGDIIDDPPVAAVTLTGSTPAGRAVASRAGQALKKCVLELGGSDAYIILEDADLDRAADICVAGRLINSGQSCVAAKRFIVVETVRQGFEARVVERMARAKVGVPLDEQVTVGPLARTDLRDELHAQVQTSIERGARCLLGGAVPGQPGAWYPPTVLTDVHPGMPAYDDELFGPVAAIIAARDEHDAIRTANDSQFGLGSGVITRDLARGERIAATELEAGSSFVNGHVRSDPRLPFGGIKQSGYGRELGAFGIREFTNIKTVVVSP